MGYKSISSKCDKSSRITEKLPIFTDICAFACSCAVHVIF
jgi:hypothetical protein